MRFFLTLVLMSAFLVGKYSPATVLASQAAQENRNDKLIDASRTGQIESVRGLLAAGAQVNAKHSETGLTALMEAARQGYTEIVNLLLKAGADVNAPVDWGQTRQYAAALKYWNAGKSTMIGGDANRKVLRVYGTGWTALMSAAEGGYTEIVRLLIQKGALVNASVLCANSWVQGYIFNKEFPYRRHKDFTLGPKPTRHYFSSADVPAQKIPDEVHVDSIDCMTALMMATENSHVESMKILIDAGANVHKQCSFGDALALAVDEEEPKAVNLLLQNGANANSKDKLGQPVLAMAVENENIEIVKLLLQAGANPNAILDETHPGPSGKTVLMQAVEDRNIEIVKLLLQSRAKVNLQDEDGNTALIWAVDVSLNSTSSQRTATPNKADGKNELGEIVRLLLASGADSSIENKKAETALSLTTDPEIVKLFRTSPKLKR